MLFQVILPCVWVGYNVSGGCAIKDGYLTYDGQNIYSMNEINNKLDETSEPGLFRMETGRELFPYLHVCNKAKLCSKKFLGSVTITSPQSEIKTSDGIKPLVFPVATSPVGIKRFKRETNTKNITVQTPPGI